MMDIDNIRSYWDAHPLCASAIPYAPGTPAYFQYYDQLREANESVAFSYRLHDYNAFSGKRVLDIGCGNGYVLSRYAREGAHVYGVDLSPVAIGLCVKRFDQLGLRGEFAAANLEELPFADNYFDALCCMGVLHHTPNPNRGVQEFLRVLKPGGRLMMMVYHRNSALYRLNFGIKHLLTGKSIQTMVNEVDGQGNPIGDVYSKTEITRLLNGFVELETFVHLLEGWMTLPKIGDSIPRVLLQPFGRWLGWFLYAKAKKPA